MSRQQGIESLSEEGNALMLNSVATVRDPGDKTKFLVSSDNKLGGLEHITLPSIYKVTIIIANLYCQNKKTKNK